MGYANDSIGALNELERQRLGESPEYGKPQIDWGELDDIRHDDKEWQR